MSHLPPLVSDLGLILIVAGIVTILFKLLKQPVVLGYIVAGFLISPHFVLFPSVVDTANISTWAEIGVIFLLFALGLEFSFKKLMDVGGTASIGTLINMGSMLVIGYIIGQLMGWTQMESVFLGGMLSMSSTTIIIKAFNDMGLQKKRFANIVFGMLIVEDLAAILMMVLLTTVATSGDGGGATLLESSLKLVFFMMIWFVVGIYLIPSLLKALKKHLNDETLIIVAVGLCLGMVMFADAVGFSAALGAFIMGSILAETIEAKHIEHLFEPIKNLFGAVFFVSVGMMIVPSIILEYAVPILIFTVVVLVGRVIFASLGVLASGEGLKVSIQSGFSLAQIGEFSFIIATLGMQLGVISDFIYPIIVAVSVITTFTTPYLIKASTPAFNAIEKRVPQKWEKLITGYSSSNRKTVNRQNDWNVLLKRVSIRMVIFFVLSIAVFFICKELLYWHIMSYIPNIGGRIASAIITLLLMTPFMGAIMTSNNNTEEFKRLWEDSHFNKGALIALKLFKMALCATLSLIVLIPLFPRATVLLLTASGLIAIVLTLIQGFGKQTSRMENQFLRNLNDKELTEDKKGTINNQVKTELLNKNIHLEEIEVPQNSPRIGKTLAELDTRQTTGVDIVSIIRGELKINIPDANEHIYPFDKVIVAGTDEEIQAFIATMGDIADEQYSTPPQYQLNLSQYELEEGSPLIGKELKDSQIRQKTDTMVIGIDRNDESITNISANTILEKGDILWLAGEQIKLASFQNNINS